jgi:hypothetical protein
MIITPKHRKVFNILDLLKPNKSLKRVLCEACFCHHKKGLENPVLKLKNSKVMTNHISYCFFSMYGYTYQYFLTSKLRNIDYDIKSFRKL